MDIVLENFWKIRENPDDYLPERSLWALRGFRRGYSGRARMEGLETRLGQLFSGFQSWLENHFSIGISTPRSVYHIVDSYSSGPEDAFMRFFALFEQYVSGISTSLDENKNSRRRPEKYDLFEVIRSIRKRPELYLGYPHFSGIHVDLSGHERAGIDLGLPKTPEEQFYDEFKLWIVSEKYPGGMPRPWFKLIHYHSFHDCGISTTSAYAVFFELLDEFAEKKGRASLFKISIS